MERMLGQFFHFFFFFFFLTSCYCIILSLCFCCSVRPSVSHRLPLVPRVLKADKRQTGRRERDKTRAEETQSLRRCRVTSPTPVAKDVRAVQCKMSLRRRAEEGWDILLVLLIAKRERERGGKEEGSVCAHKLTDCLTLKEFGSSFTDDAGWCRRLGYEARRLLRIIS